MHTRYLAFALPALILIGLASAIILPSDATPEQLAATTPAISATSEAEPAGPAQVVAETTAAATVPPASTTTTTPPCENGTAVPSPADNPGLVADCTALLAAKDPLRGTATLNWSADRAITAWDGITVASVPYGAPQRVTKVVLRSGSLNGTVPAALADLSALRELRLQWNELTGTIPAELGNLTQLTYLGLGGTS